MKSRRGVGAALIASVAVVLILLVVGEQSRHELSAPGASTAAGPATPSGSRPAAVQGSAGLILVGAGLAVPASDGTVRLDAAAVAAKLAQVPVAGPSAGSYRRDSFGPAWADVDHNGCDTRNDVLRRDLTDVELKPGTHGCVVLAGVLHDPYTGHEIAFTRGLNTSEAVQIDHVVPLAYAAAHGAALWTAQKREAFANDPSELLAVDGSANQEKSDAGPESWMPAGEDRCGYVAQFTLIAWTYRLSIDTGDRAAITDQLAACG